MRKLIITPKKLHTENDNINGPTVIKVPKWINDPLGRYYMYFAHHKGSHIKLRTPHICKFILIIVFTLSESSVLISITCFSIDKFL